VIQRPGSTLSLLHRGETCWKVSTAARASLLVDGQSYFAALRSALLQARRHILIAGWDFDTRAPLPPLESDGADSEESTAPLPLGELLGYLVRTRPGIEIHVARWNYHWLYRDDREADTREKLERLGVRFYDDCGHPVTGCVHHKVVVIDDVLAFCGGMDLTHDRWDTCNHEAEDERRLNHGGKRYMPVHDTQLCVSGPAARDLGEYQREHWPTRNALPPLAAGGSEIWPHDLPVDFRDIRVGISRTRPSSPDCAPMREIEAFFLSAIASTERSLYVENQYFTSTRIADAIAEQCARQAALEGLLVGMARPKTPVELHTMGYGLTRFHRALEERGADRRVPLVAALCGGDKTINMHSKLAVFDDRWLTCGSANLNWRSMGFDIECNLVLEATTPEHEQQMQALRDRLLAEHLGMQVEEVIAAIREYGLAQLPSVVQRVRRLVRLQPRELRPTFGPILAPLFDREETWMPPAVSRSFREASQ
jgi:phospholipase D1/2